MRRTNECNAAATNKMDAHKIIKAMRIYLGMSQADAAKKAGISEAVYQKYENVPGEILKGHFSSVYRILEIMHLNPQKIPSWKIRVE